MHQIYSNEHFAILDLRGDAAFVRSAALVRVFQPTPFPILSSR